MSNAQTQTPQTAARAGRRLPVPKTWSIRADDIILLLFVNALLIGGMWLRHGGLSQLGYPAGILTAIGQVTALYATYLVLIQLVLLSRAPWLDQVFGQDNITVAHRRIGLSVLALLSGHVIFSTLGYAWSGAMSPIDEFVLLLGFPYIVPALIGTVLFFMIGLSSLPKIRAWLSYETWYYLHLWSYVAVAAAFLHQIFLGVDFVDDQVASLYWIVLYLATAVLVVAFRFWGPISISRRHRFRVQNVIEESPGVFSFYLVGRDLDALPLRAGQWFRLRFISGLNWLYAHPFSLSAAPNGRYLRFTVKELGDHTRAMSRIKIGTGVFLEGPYGSMTAAVRTKPRALMIAGGIGITPLLAMLDEMSLKRDHLSLIYRASDPDQVVFRGELNVLAFRRGITVHYLLGRRVAGEPDPLDPESLVSLIPDIIDCDVYLCGPNGMMDKVLDSLSHLEIPTRQIHYERFAF